MESHRNISEFILPGLSYDENIQIFCFMLLLFCYLALLVRNLLILVSIQCSPLFNEPVYCFLSDLSFIGICYSSSVTSKFIGHVLVESKTFPMVFTQVLIVHIFGDTEIFLFTTVIFDHYVVICNTLHYVIIMNRMRCNLLHLAAWAGGTFHPFFKFLWQIGLPFCGPNENPSLFLLYFSFVKNCLY